MKYYPIRNYVGVSTHIYIHICIHIHICIYGFYTSNGLGNTLRIWLLDPRGGFCIPTAAHAGVLVRDGRIGFQFEDCFADESMKQDRLSL